MKAEPTLGRSAEPVASAPRAIAFVITSIGNQGGAEACLVQLATGLRVRGWSVRVISLRTPSDERKVERLEDAGILVASLGLEKVASLPTVLPRLASMIRAAKPDVVHTHLVHANLLGRMARPLAPVPVLVSAARNTYEGPRWRTWAYRMTDRWCDVTVQVSQLGAEQSVATGAVPGDKIRVIPNGVNTSYFSPDTDARQRIRAEAGVEGRFVWLATGRLAPLKDYPNALAAFAEVLSVHGDAELWIAGDGELAPDLRRLARRRGIDSSVRFLGHQTDVRGFLNAADGYLMSSAWEGMPNALLEAAAVGVPAVATAVGGNPEIVRHAETGYLVPPGDDRALSEAMLQMMSLPDDERHRMGWAARARAAEHFALEAMVDQWEQLYVEFIRSIRPSTPKAR